MIVRRTGSTPPPPPPNEAVIDASFDGGADGFTFVDDAFRNTTQPNFASGSHQPTLGVTGGGLQVLVGGINNADILNMSGGWRRTFTLSEPRQLTMTFRYQLTQASNYESDEFTEALLSLDDQLIGPNNSEVLARVTGDGNGGPNRGTGWVALTLDLGTLSPGNHSITIGGFNNKKTFSNEISRVLIDDVVIR